MAAASAAPTAPKRKPGWMSMPGGPKEPNRQEYRKKFDALVAEKSKCFEVLKDIRAQFDAERAGMNADEASGERAMLKARLDRIAGERGKERAARKSAEESLRGTRTERRKIEAQLKELANEVGVFKDLEEIDMAIDHVMLKMETGSGDLKAEKMTIKRLNKLEEAKGLLLQLAPMEEAIADAEERENELQAEVREIHSRIDALNKDFETNLNEKMAKDKERKKSSIDRDALMAKRKEASEKIDKINAQIDEHRTSMDAAVKAWEEWRVKAMADYKKQQDEIYAARRAAWEEKEKQRKNERKKLKAAKKINPHSAEIDSAEVLVKYLKAKMVAREQERQEAERRKKLAAFDASASAPDGAKVMGRDDDWLFIDRTNDKKSGKNNKKPAAAASAAKKDNKGDDGQQKKLIQHSADKLRAFERCGVTAPATHGDVEATIKKLQEKKKEWESKIITNLDDIEVSSSDDEAEAAEEETAVASTMAA